MPKLEEQTFCTLFSGFERLLSVDLSGCIGLQPNSLQLMLTKNANLIHLQLSGCSDAINEVSMKGISNLKKLQFLDVSYCKNVTEKECAHFIDKRLPLAILVANSCVGLNAVGLSTLIKAGQTSLQEFEAADNDHIGQDFLKQLGQCWNLNYVDISGCTQVDDSGIKWLTASEAQLRKVGPPVTPGLIMLTTLKVSMTKIGTVACRVQLPTASSWNTQSLVGATKSVSKHFPISAKNYRT